MITAYLAGASREAKRVRSWAEKLEQTGVIQIAHRWFNDAEQWAGKDAEMDLETASSQAMACLEELARAKVLWVLWPNQPTVGAFVELGAALERRRILSKVVEDNVLANRDTTFATKRKPHIVVTGAGFADSAFTSLVDYREAEDVFGFHECVRVANLAAKKG